MSAFATTANSGMKTEAAPAGPHAAILIGVIDLGTHLEEFDEEKDGKKTGKKREKEVRKILLGWELPSQFIAGTTPPRTHVITKDYILSGHIKSGMRKMLEGWRGKAFAENEQIDPFNALGKSCLINIKHGTSGKGTVYANLDSVMPLPPEMKVAISKRKVVSWTFTDGQAAFLAIDWMPMYLYGEKLSDMMGRAKELRPAGSAAVKKPDAAPIADEPENVNAPPPQANTQHMPVDIAADTVPF